MSMDPPFEVLNRPLSYQSASSILALALNIHVIFLLEDHGWFIKHENLDLEVS